MIVAGGRMSSDPARQQQRLLPGQHNQLVRLAFDEKERIIGPIHPRIDRIPQIGTDGPAKPNFLSGQPTTIPGLSDINWFNPDGDEADWDGGRFVVGGIAGRGWAKIRKSNNRTTMFCCFATRGIEPRRFQIPKGGQKIRLAQIHQHRCRGA